MDSLTQIVLGAACGELVAGRKLGNKAMLLGAIGGTIPDLDVFIGNWIFHQEIDKLAFHRGFMHSFLFAFLACWILGYVSKLFQKDKSTTSLSFLQWTWFWLLCIITHPILDSFTAYGTQVFQPFSEYRVAFNNISVVDLFYTLPFMVCMIVVLFYAKKSPSRRKWAWRGVIISSVYMLCTFGNKLYINHTFSSALEKEGIEYQRLMTQPTLGTNFLWYGVAEKEDAYLYAYYSWFDSQPISFDTLQKNDSLRKVLSNSYVSDRLQWFSNSYYIVRKKDNDTLIFSDIRYPILQNTEIERSVFSFKLYKDSIWKMHPFEPDFDPNAFRDLGNRILGN